MTDGQTDLERLTSGKYVRVTTFRRDGTEVPTPVWVIQDGDALGVWTVADSGKVKRIRNRADVLVSACDIRGNPSGEVVPGRAAILNGEQTRHYRRLLVRKYGLTGRLTLLGSRLRRGVDGTVGIRITLD
ncbi:PPOX class F420-dependent oxidoreductase [Streptomyces sp. CBMA29]|uniref:PPOX class F420-dependent oxidoreductase n=1 Tax=Streptomyces sp. CBMA29 TaxID=1896314 RepID=UPI0016620981|nr:PPOX class F420-dependent oxidoreductase [Streptomyces sp. CBMA29]MBD0740325.1 PPOX class F420-dependent enzyme [Streptomyces sp. CBMA29]